MILLIQICLYISIDLYIIKFNKPNKTFIGILISTDENICNFVDLNNEETISLLYENNEELSSMIIQKENKSS